MRRSLPPTLRLSSPAVVSFWTSTFPLAPLPHLPPPSPPSPSTLTSTPDAIQPAPPSPYLPPRPACRRRLLAAPAAAQPVPPRRCVPAANPPPPSRRPTCRRRTWLGLGRRAAARRDPVRSSPRLAPRLPPPRRARACAGPCHTAAPVAVRPIAMGAPTAAASVRLRAPHAGRRAAARRDPVRSSPWLAPRLPPPRRARACAGPCHTAAPVAVRPIAMGAPTAAASVRLRARHAGRRAAARRDPVRSSPRLAPRLSSSRNPTSP